MHYGKLTGGDIKLGDELTVCVDEERRHYPPRAQRHASSAKRAAHGALATMSIRPVHL